MGNRIVGHGDRVGSGRQSSMGRLWSVPRARIVVGVDGSASSIAAVRWAAHHGEVSGAQLQAVISWGIHGAAGEPSGPPDKLAEDARARANMSLYRALGTTWADVAEVRVTRGSPAEVLVQAASGAKLVVVGSSAPLPQSRFRPGSIGGYVVARSSCPVVIVRSAHTGPQSRRADESSPLTSWEYIVWPGHP